MPSLRLVPVLALLACGGSAGAVDLSGVQIHGFASQGWLYTDDDAIFSENTADGGTFDFNEFGVNFTATPIERLRVGAQLFANSLGDLGKDRVQLDWAYGQYEVPTGAPAFALTVQAGRFKTGYGLYNDYRDLDMTRTQVFLPMSVYAPQFRDFFLAVNGGGVITTLRPGAFGTVELSAFVGGQSIRNDSPIATAFASAAGVAGIDGISVKRFDGGSLGWEPPIDGLRFKGSLLHASHLVGDTYVLVTTPPSTIATKVSTPTDLTTWFSAVGGAEYQRGDLTLAAEYSNMYYKAVADTTAIGGGINTFYSRLQAAYATASYRVRTRWEGSLGTGWSYEKEAVHDAVGSFTRTVALALRYDFTDHWLAKAEFQRNRGTQLLTNTGVATIGDDEYWNLFAVKTTFDF